MDNSDSAPDSWEQADIDAPEAQLNSSLALLNVNAKPFVPNVHAAEFVPSFLIKSSGPVDRLEEEEGKEAAGLGPGGCLSLPSRGPASPCRGHTFAEEPLGPQN